MGWRRRQIGAGDIMFHHSLAPVFAFNPRGVKNDPPSPLLRVLVVDDELLIRWSIAETLTAAGHRVFEASDAAATRYLIDHLDPPVDVILLDHRLPDNDDLTLLADVRRMSPATAVVMMTAHRTPELAAAAARLGARELLEKPFDIRLVEPALQNAYAARAEEMSQHPRVPRGRYGPAHLVPAGSRHERCSDDEAAASSRPGGER
jgi:DNA-binding NtrC family response regulator